MKKNNLILSSIIIGICIPLLLAQQYASQRMLPGYVPIGGMIAVMPATHANAWQPPADCTTIKDGFMRTSTAAGVACVVPTCADCAIPAGTTLPNMWQTYPRGGATTSNTGSSNAVSLAANQIPTHTTDGAGSHSHTWPPRAGSTQGNWSTDSAASVAVSGGYGDGSQNTYSDGNASVNAWGTGASPYHTRSSAGRSAGHTHSGTTGGISANHTHAINNAILYFTGGGAGCPSGSGIGLAQVYQGGIQNTGTVSSDHTHNITTGGESVDHSHSYYLPSHRNWIMTRTTGDNPANHSHTYTNGSLQTVSREPAYREVVWVIRVK